MKVGDKVVFVQDYPPLERALAANSTRLEILPVVGETYTVREIFMHPVSRMLEIYLVEIVNPVYEYADRTAEVSWAAYRFREIDTPSELQTA